MTPQELSDLFVDKSDVDLLGPCLQDDLTPFVFSPKPDRWDAFRNEVGQQLGANPEDIRIVGSGRFGFSLNPTKKLRAFTDGSDVDTVIVSADLFDQLWYALLTAFYPRPPATQQVGGWLEDRQKELYTGWLSPKDIQLDQRIFGQRAKVVTDVRTHWFNTLKKASSHIVCRHEDVTVRLYRTWNHAKMYHLHSLGVLRKTLRKVKKP